MILLVNGSWVNFIKRPQPMTETLANDGECQVNYHLFMAELFRLVNYLIYPDGMGMGMEKCWRFVRCITCKCSDHWVISWIHCCVYERTGKTPSVYVHRIPREFHAILWQGKIFSMYLPSKLKREHLPSFWDGRELFLCDIVKWNGLPWLISGNKMSPNLKTFA